VRSRRIPPNYSKLEFCRFEPFQRLVTEKLKKSAPIGQEIFAISAAGFVIGGTRRDRSAHYKRYSDFQKEKCDKERCALLERGFPSLPAGRLRRAWNG
jgi:hypothetical protein